MPTSYRNAVAALSTVSLWLDCVPVVGLWVAGPAACV